MSGPPKVFTDLADFAEDARIGIIGRTVLDQNKTVAVCVDKEPPAKVQRYMKKLRGRFKGIKIEGPFNGPVKGVVFINVSPL